MDITEFLEYHYKLYVEQCKAMGCPPDALLSKKQYAGCPAFEKHLNKMISEELENES